MRMILKASKLSLIALAFVATFAASARAQIHDDRIVLARAGGVNLVEGDVTTRRAGSKEWQKLSVRDELRSGDAVRTGAGGRVEILLNPGSYFRAGADAEFVLADESLDDLRLALARGSAVVEATGFSDLDLSITIASPRSRAQIIRTGVYRLDVLPSGELQLSVLKGRAVAGTGILLVKGGQVARTAASGVEVSKLDKTQRDALDLWSRDRGKELARANEKLSRRNTNSLLARVNFDTMFAGSRFGYGGLWLWSGAKGCYTFLPFYGGWESPYGFWYGSGFPIYAFNDCRCGPRGEGYRQTTISRGGTTYTPPPTPTTWTPPTPGGNPGGVPVGPPSPQSPDPRPPVVREAMPETTHERTEGGFSRTPRSQP